MVKLENSFLNINNTLMRSFGSGNEPIVLNAKTAVYAKIGANVIPLIEGGSIITDVSWEEVKNKPKWITNTKPIYTKEEVGLSNVDNTSDADKPISKATKEALDNKANITDLNNKYDKTGGLISGNVQVQGIIEATGDIIAKKDKSVIFVAQTQGGAGYLWELLDTEITEPKKGDILMFDGVSWVNAKRIDINGGTYNGF